MAPNEHRSIDYEPTFVLWPTIAIENSASEVQRLRSILQRLIDALEPVDLGHLTYAQSVILGNHQITSAQCYGVAEHVRVSSEALAKAFEILAELDPLPPDEDEEGENDGH